MKKGSIAIISLLVLSLASLIVAFTTRSSAYDVQHIASGMSSSVERKLQKLDNLGKKALEQDRRQWLEIGKVPDDMVIYRYVYDSLQSWKNQFPLKNDNINSKTVFQVLSNPRINISSPLADVGDVPGLFNFGSNWYIVKAVASEDGTVRIVEGLRIDGNIVPLSATEGTPVIINGKPLFKVMGESLNGPSKGSMALVLLAMALLISAMLCFLMQERTLKRFWISVGVMLSGIILLYVWGRFKSGSYQLLSPILYADGNFLYSLGAVFLTDLAIVLICVSLYIVKRELARRMRSAAAMWASLAAITVSITVIAIYVHLSVCSIVRNSNICLELYKLEQMSVYSVLVLISRTAVLLCIPVLLQLFRSGFLKLFGWRFDAFSRKSRLVTVGLIAVYLVAVPAVLGFHKEKNRVSVWADRLAVDRDIALELTLRSAEGGISSDMFISALSVFDGMESTILNRITEFYLVRIPQEFTTYVKVFNGSDGSSDDAAFFNERLTDADPVYNGSRFFFRTNASGRVEYTGVFHYFTEEYGPTTVMLCLDGKQMGVDKGYATLLDMLTPGKVSIPSEYSYAKYRDRDLQLFRGDYPYSTSLNDSQMGQMYESEISDITSDGYINFINRISSEEVVVISRRVQSPYQYLIAVVFLATVAYIPLSVSVLGRRRRKRDRSVHMFRTRITWHLMISLVITLAVLTTVSVVFVYRRNEDNMHRIMVDRLNAVQNLVQAGIRNSTPMLESVKENTGADVTLFSVQGQAVMSTSPQVFDRMLVGTRVDSEAYRQIVYENKRYCLIKDKANGKRYYSMYAPVFGDDSNMLAILCTPYVEDGYDFEKDAFIHSMSIISVFLILLIIARIMTSTVLARLFRPLSEMGVKMSSTNINSLEFVSYDRNDEITSLVNAYNRMVRELSESTRKLAQAERDKAWSGMARQVAHEIKNPLTPMKLQIQRLIRLKEKNASDWQEKFDEVSAILLDHIDILSNTANEFSTFAKLYSEESTSFDLDKVLRKEISMFDSRDDISFEYMGLADAVVTGPKPQLTRVFVNLINNAVQAVDERGDGRIVVSLRNSVRDGYYDIVVEDNGDGVSDENISKLFTPNFTTKSSGSGLGLAISRSILEKCDATISYSKSFTLGGACFTVIYPKPKSI